jgi:hypothetical protein
MLPLYQKAIAFLLRGGYRVTRSQPGFAEVEYAGDDATTLEPRLLLWVADDTLRASRGLSEIDRVGRAAREDALITHMISEVQATPATVAYYLVPSRQGLSQNFVTSATRVLQRNRRDGRGGIRVEIEFFDTAYKLDTAAGQRVKASVFASLLTMAAKRRRVAQPFAIRRGLGPQDVTPGAADLVEHLETKLRDPIDRPTLRIIDGPAGSGKSVAFEALADKTYQEFMAAKKADVLRPRPIVFLPEHIRGQSIGYVDDIIDAMTDAEVAAPVAPEQLRFLLKEGHAVWMLDGLDEFFSGDNDFFPFLTEQLSSPDSRAQILICTRDSLLTSSSALRSFVEHAWSKGIAVEIYELNAWGPAAWRDLAWLELENGRKGGDATPLVNGFVDALTAVPELSQVAALPFYCTVLLDQYRKTKTMPADSLMALDTILDRMLTREEGKSVFQWREFVDADVLADLAETDADGIDKSLFDGRSATHAIEMALDAAGRDTVIEMLGMIAHQRCRSKPKATDGVAVTDMTDVLSPVYVPDGGDDTAQQRLATALVQFAFFGAGRRAGVVDFTHPILAEYLAGLYAAGLLARVSRQGATGSPLSQLAVMRGSIQEAIGAVPIVPGSVFHRTLTRAVRADPQMHAFLTGAAAVLAAQHLDAAIKLLLA